MFLLLLLQTSIHAKLQLSGCHDRGVCLLCLCLCLCLNLGLKGRTEMVRMKGLGAQMRSRVISEVKSGEISE
ncbi:hypothetical protein ASPBRDRAFT_355459 [Aspergillus brasiliensis CBS 101740]|uniref:Uncharacterized protein n=1 Tax=Aspergillus brasiliensis (strain CBS 101740 / IMI 381727 / IBT 21946) TaxID=767769 RepID=A0A1L9U5C7_ASPBC|nr:hypothetical protein ASPBRDRAFT_355459 [Aspergillus brasiliensis CBS 101740]